MARGLRVVMLPAAAAALAAARGALTIAAPATVRRVTRPGSSPLDVRVQRAARAVASAAAHSPFTFTCLEQAVALCLLLALVGRRGQVVLGVGPAPGTLRAHAWVECGGRIVLGERTDASDLVPLTRPVRSSGA